MGKQMKMVFISLLVLLVLGSVTKAGAGRVSNTLTVAKYFNSHMVLQRDTSVPIWGTATPNTVIKVRINQNLVATADVGLDGKWTAWLPDMEANDVGAKLTIEDTSKDVVLKSITFEDVLVGEVWVLSGQSNMNLQLTWCEGGDSAISSSDLYPNIRLYMLPQTGSFPGVWEVSNSTNTPDWSGVGYFFAQQLSDKVGGVPVGLIQVAKNGTSISSWTTTGGGSNGKLYKDNIKPLQPFAIRGVLWYQGEDDGSQESSALAYYKMLPGLIKEWRGDWGQGDFPFYYVQLAPISGRPNWAIVRDAQVSTLDLQEPLHGETPVPNTAMACIIDVPTVPSTEIHPPDKEPVGYRLALAARALIYDETDLAYSGPIRDINPLKSHLSDDKIIISFKHTEPNLLTDTGSVTKSFYLTDGGLVTSDNQAPGPFMIAGADGVYQNTTAQIVGDTVVVSNPSKINPVTVRYCWGSYPVCNLFNSSNHAPYLPASPFQLTFPLSAGQ